MKKLTLDVTDLKVESFPTAAVQTREGTVKANEDTAFCSASCQPTCGIVPMTYDCEGETLGCEGAAAVRPTSFGCTTGGETDDYTGCLPCCV